MSTAHPRSEGPKDAAGLPMRLGRYLLLERLPGGGMTEVYTARLAEQVGPGRLLVIKLLPRTEEGDTAAELRFLREARILLGLTHGNVTTAFEFGRADDRPFLVMEYVAGVSLRRLIDEVGPLTVPEAIFVARELSRALSYAHAHETEDGERGLLHRDVSPDNVLISGAGQVKLTDFGIAEFARGAGRGPLMGKAAYLAPEVASGEAPGPAADLYSLAVVLFESLTGAPPLLGRDDAETLRLARDEIPRSLSQLRDDVPAELARCVDGMLAKRPADRPCDAADLEARLGELLAEVSGAYTESTFSGALARMLPADSLRPRGGGEPPSRERVGPGPVTVEILGQGTDPLEADRSREGAGGRRDARSPRPFAAIASVVGLVAVIGLLVLLDWGSDSADSPGTDVAALSGVGVTGAVAASQRADVDTAAASRRDAGATAAALGTRRDGGGDRSGSSVRARPHGRAEEREAVEGDAAVQKPRTRSKETRFGYVNINSSPWSYVTVDGRRLEGHTPMKRVRLRPGSHVIVFENPGLGLEAERRIRVRPLEELTVGVRLERDDAR